MTLGLDRSARPRLRFDKLSVTRECARDLIERGYPRTASICKTMSMLLLTIGAP